MNEKLAAAIPIKGLAGAKSRLSPVLSHEERVCLIVDMLDHMLCVLQSAPEIGEVFVITPDPAIARYVSLAHPQVRLLRDAGGLNESAAACGDRITREGFSSMLFLLGDLPLLAAEDITRAAGLGREHPVVLLPDRRGEGTNGVLLTPPAAIKTQFGAGSLRAHLAAAKAAGIDAALLETEGFSHDLDTPEDLCEIQKSHSLCPKSARAFRICLHK